MRTLAATHNERSLDHLICAHQQRLPDCDPQRRGVFMLTISATHQRTNAIWRSKSRNKPWLHEFDAVDAFEASQRECLGAHPHQLHIKRRRQAVLVKHPFQAKQSRSENVAVQVRA